MSPKSTFISSGVLPLGDTREAVLSDKVDTSLASLGSSATGPRMGDV